MSNLCDYNAPYILVRGEITIIGCNLAAKLAFENCAPFVKCIRNTDGTTKDDLEDL